MLGVRHTDRIVWRRRHATRHYLGYVIVGDDSVRLAGDEEGTGIHAVLSIPLEAIGTARVGHDANAEVAGEPAVVLELADDDPILLRPLATSPLALDDLARRLSVASAPEQTARATA
jgi:hypothetical protein